ncbi:MAG: hypothetical protein V1832_00910 [Nitrospirota bacterium]
MASSSRLKPGEEGKIVATIKGTIGFITKTVKVFTNDPKKPVVALVLKALIKTQPASPSQPISPPQQPSSSSQQPSSPSQPAFPPQPASP